MHRKSEKVSVIVPCYNAELYIQETINSILGQTYRNVEIIVINDGSNDSSEMILEQYLEKITVIKQENKGVAKSRNTGVAKSNGRYISFCDSDDVWMPWKLERQIEIFEKFPDVGVVCSNMLNIDAESRIIPGGKSLRRSYYNRPINLRTQLLMEGNIISLSSSIAKREIIENIEGFDIKHNIISKDYDLWLKASEYTMFYIFSEPLGSYRVLQHSMLHGSLRKEYKPQFQWLYIHKGKYSEDQYRKRKAKIYRDWAEDSFYNRNPFAWKLLRKSMDLDKGNIELHIFMIKEAVKYFGRRIIGFN